MNSRANFLDMLVSYFLQFGVAAVNGKFLSAFSAFSALLIFLKNSEQIFQVIPTDPVVGQCIGMHRRGHKDTAIGSLERMDRAC